MKDNISRAINALRQNALKPGKGKHHPKLAYALLQHELSLLDEIDREDEHPHPDDIIHALTRDMLLEAVLRIE